MVRTPTTLISLLILSAPIKTALSTLDSILITTRADRSKSHGARLCTGGCLIVHRWAQQACVAYTQSFCHDTSNSSATSPNVIKNSYLILDIESQTQSHFQGPKAILYEQQSSLQKTAHTLHHIISLVERPLTGAPEGHNFGSPHCHPADK